MIDTGQFKFIWQGGKIVVYNERNPERTEATPDEREKRGFPRNARVGGFLEGEVHEPTTEERAVIDQLLGYPTQDRFIDQIPLIIFNPAASFLDPGLTVGDVFDALPDEYREDLQIYTAIAAHMTGNAETLIALQERECKARVRPIKRRSLPATSRGAQSRTGFLRVPR